MSKKHKRENKVPSDKHEAKQRGVRDRFIFSINTMKDYTNKNHQFVKYCKKNFGVDMIKNITTNFIFFK